MLIGQGTTSTPIARGGNNVLVRQGTYVFKGGPK
jgi:hypothetical protein